MSKTKLFTEKDVQEMISKALGTVTAPSATVKPIIELRKTGYITIGVHGDKYPLNLSPSQATVLLQHSDYILATVKKLAVDAKNIRAEYVASPEYIKAKTDKYTARLTAKRF